MKFFEKPILNSPYQVPSLHWELSNGLPTQKVIHSRRRVEFITPIPRPKLRGNTNLFDESLGLGAGSYDPVSIINELRGEVERWRELDSREWRVSPVTARLLRHWRHYEFQDIRPFFCQIEAVEAVIWLVEVAPKLGKNGKKFLDYLKNANEDANPGLERLALKLATGAGKTTVMAMLIAWQTLNAVRCPASKKFSRGFLVIAPGLTIKDRLQVLLPNDPNSYYKNRELVPLDMLADLQKAKVVIANFHVFKLREHTELSTGTRALLKGRTGEALDMLESEGEMLSRVMGPLMGIKNIMVFNDEAHHCYRRKPGDDEEVPKKKDWSPEESKEAKSNQEAARLWISGLEVVKRKLGILKIIDLSATPFFLRGSGYAEGTLFPWTMNDFSLMDAIECGIVKLPRVPVSDNIPAAKMPRFRELWKHIRLKMPKKGRKSKGEMLDPHRIPVELQTALEALYGHYEKTFALWQKAGLKVPPCFIVVCNNTSASKLIYDYISGFFRKDVNGVEEYQVGRLKLFRNFDDYGNPLPMPKTLLIDSQQLESGDALESNFREMAKDEIERYRREMVQRGGAGQGERLSDCELLRGVMNTVGKEGTLGAGIRCVVSVSMLTEGWDANNVTHVLGVRAFGTQLLCEQVIGRALRRESYTLNAEGLFDAEYADVLGIPFDFTAAPVVVGPKPPRRTIWVKAVRPERDRLELRFPRVEGYRTVLPTESLKARFTEDSILELTPELLGPSSTQNAGIIGQSVDLNLEHTKDFRHSSLIYELSIHLLQRYYRDANGEPKNHLFVPLKRIVRQWLQKCLVCKGETFPAQLRFQELANMACSRISAAITACAQEQGLPIQVILNPYNPAGSTMHVNFSTSKSELWETDSRKCHINWVVLDSSWEKEFCRVAEAHKRVLCYAKNHSLGLEVPYRYGSQKRYYRPDFILQIDMGNNEPLNLIVEIKGFRGEDAKEKKLAIENFWIPGVNALKEHGNFEDWGRWAFAEFRDVFAMQQDFAAKLEEEFGKMIDTHCK